MIKIDYELLFLASENARYKLKELGKLLKKSSQRLKYALRQIEKEEILYHPYCVIDYSYFGLILFRVYFKGGYISEKEKQSMITTLQKNPLVTSIYELAGGFDLVIEFTAPNPSRFNKELRKIGTLMPSLNNYHIILNIVSHLYSRIYLPKNKIVTEDTEDEIIIGGDRTPYVFNEQEKKILHQLLLNPRVRYISLAEKTDLNIKTVITTIKKLKRAKIIRGYKQLLNGSKAGIVKFRLFLKLHNLSIENEKKFMDYLSQTKESVQMHKTVGDWDMEIDIEAKEQIVIRKIISSLREEFKDLIESFNVIEIYQHYKKSSLPLHIFEEEQEMKN